MQGLAERFLSCMWLGFEFLIFQKQKVGNPVSTPLIRSEWPECCSLDGKPFDSSVGRAEDCRCNDLSSLGRWFKSGSKEASMFATFYLQ